MLYYFTYLFYPPTPTPTLTLTLTLSGVNRTHDKWMTILIPLQSTALPLSYRE